MVICAHRDDIFDGDGNLLPNYIINSGPHDSCSSCFSTYTITGTSGDLDGHPNVDGSYVYYGDYVSSYACTFSNDVLDKKIIFSNGSYYLFSDNIVVGDCNDWIISDVLPDVLLRDNDGVIEEQSSILYWAMDGGYADESLWWLGHSGNYFDVNNLDITRS